MSSLLQCKSNFRNLVTLRPQALALPPSSLLCHWSKHPNTFTISPSFQTTCKHYCNTYLQRRHSSVHTGRILDTNLPCSFSKGTHYIHQHCEVQINSLLYPLSPFAAEMRLSLYDSTASHLPPPQIQMSIGQPQNSHNSPPNHTTSQTTPQITPQTTLPQTNQPTARKTDRQAGRQRRKQGTQAGVPLRRRQPSRHQTTLPHTQ